MDQFYLFKCIDQFLIIIIYLIKLYMNQLYHITNIKECAVYVYKNMTLINLYNGNNHIIIQTIYVKNVCYN